MPPALSSILHRLKSACEQNQALLALTGKPGSGKSSALRWLSAQLPLTTHEVLPIALMKRQTEPGWLAPRLGNFMGVVTAQLTAEPLLRAISARLDELIVERRALLIAIDGAHLLETAAAFDELTALINLQSYGRPCLSFILCGNETLLDKLAALPELAGKLALHTTMPALKGAEITAYIAHRLHNAGVAATFDDTAMALIEQHTGGLMGAIDLMAENCLTEAFARSLRHIDSALAQIAAPPLLANFKPLPQQYGEPGLNAAVSHQPAGRETLSNLGGPVTLNVAPADAPISLQSLFKTSTRRKA